LPARQSAMAGSVRLRRKTHFAAIAGYRKPAI
jgi:hypothetical protein